jgi:small neutral amino acid transporter SnatA (MarC family)
MVGRLWRGLNHEDVARFAFLLATPTILAVGALKLPGLAGSAGARIHGQVIVGVMVTAIAAAHLIERFSTRVSLTRRLGATQARVRGRLVGRQSLPDRWWGRAAAPGRPPATRFVDD